MTVPVLTFFNNKGGVGKTSLVYHSAWMLAELGHRVLVADLDPQANLTAAFLEEELLSELWNPPSTEVPRTIYQCVKPLTQTGDLRGAELEPILPELFLLPGDLALAGFEDLLATEWPRCLGSDNLHRAFRVVTALWQVLQLGAKDCDAAVILVDVGPSLGALNRSALIATDHLVVPLGADLFSLQGLRNLGPTLRRWRAEWSRRRENWASPDFELPTGSMQPLGYVVQQHSVRMSRPVQAYDRWVKRIPREYAQSVLGETSGDTASLELDHHRIATIKHFRSLIPLSQDARKPIFKLTPGDGAMGSHAVAAREAQADFQVLVKEILARMGL